MMVDLLKEIKASDRVPVDLLAEISHAKSSSSHPGFQVGGRSFNDPFSSRLAPAQQERDRDQQLLDQLRATAPKSASFARDLPEIGAAPELREFNLDSLKRGFAAGLIANDVELAGAIKELTPGAEVQQDPEGKVLIKFPSGGTFAINKPGLSGQDFVQFATRALAFAPSGGVVGGSVKQLGKGALAAAGTEAALQGVEAGLGGEFDKAQVGIAGAIQPVAQAIPSALGVIKRVSPKTPINNELIKAGDDAGIPVLTSDVLQPKTFLSRTLRETGEKIPIIGTAELRAAQQKFREQSLDDVADKYGEFSYDAIIKSLKSQKDKVKKAAGNAISSAESTLDDFGQIPMDKTKVAIAKVKDSISKPGILSSDADRLAVQQADNLLTTLGQTDQIFSSLRQNRTAFREVIKGVDKSERSQLTSRAKSLLNGVESAMKQDLDDFAKKNLSGRDFSRWQRANAVYAEESQKLTRSKLKNVLDKGDITPESVKTLLFSRNPSETKLLFNSLSPEGRKNARAAIISKVFDDAQSPARPVTPNSFASAMKKNSQQISTFFKGVDRRQLEGLKKLLDATRRAQDAPVTTPTGQALFGGGLALSGATMPAETLLTAGSIGGVSRLYESAPVRNALLRLASTASDSPVIDQRIQAALVAIAQSSRSLEQE